MLNTFSASIEIIMQFFFFCFLKISFYYSSSTVVSIFTPPAPCPTHPHLPPSNLPPLALSMCPLYMFLGGPSPIFPHYPSPPNPSDYCQFVLYFSVSGYILLACLFCWLVSTFCSSLLWWIALNDFKRFHQPHIFVISLTWPWCIWLD